MTLRFRAEECAEELIRLYESQPLAGVSVERISYWGEGGGVESVDVYVKSALEPSIDEVPLLDAILSSLSGLQVAVYDYDSIGERGHYDVAFRILDRGLARGKPFILVLPEQRSVVLTRYLPESEWSRLEESLALRVTVRVGNALYLPEPGVVPSARLVAKANSEQSYERVVWLSRVAEELGLRLRAPHYASSNREILDYVFSLGPRGPLERVPVNKLASYVNVLASCGPLAGRVRLLTRVESSTHYIYAYRVPGWLVERIASELESKASVELRGSLYNLAFKGASRVFEELLARLGA